MCETGRVKLSPFLFNLNYTMTITEIIEYLNALTTEEDTARRLYWGIVSPYFHPTKQNGEVWDKILKLRDKVALRSHTRGHYAGGPQAYGPWTRNPTLSKVTDALDNFIKVSRNMCDVEQIALTPMGISLFNTIDSYCEKTTV